MKVFWMFSGGASSLAATLTDGNNGTLYRNVGAYRDRKGATGAQLCKAHDIHEFFMSRGQFYDAHGLEPKSADARRRFYAALAERIELECSPDLICLSGYMHIVPENFLEYKPMLNVHPADLAILAGPNGRLDTTGLNKEEVSEYLSNGYERMLRGDDAVFDAVMKGEQFTRSTVHILTGDVDGGPVVTQSKPFAVGDGIPAMAADALAGDAESQQFIRRYVKSLQGRMKTEGDGPAYLAALEMISRGHLATEGDIIFLDGNELPYCGVRLK